MLFGQSDFTGFWQPQVALNYNVSEVYRHNFKVQGRSFFYRNDSLKLDLRQLDFAHFSTLKVRDDQSVALGLMWRLTDIFEVGRVNEFRLTEQYNLIDRTGRTRFGHRARAEQRFFPDRTIHRFRYRFALDVPLEGDVIDIGEAYFIAGIEFLLSAARAAKPQYDQRLAVHLGWLLSNKAKLQVGTEYRTENYTRNTRHLIFMETALIFFL